MLGFTLSIHNLAVLYVGFSLRVDTYMCLTVQPNLHDWCDRSATRYKAYSLNFLSMLYLNFKFPVGVDDPPRECERLQFYSAAQTWKEPWNP